MTCELKWLEWKKAKWSHLRLEMCVLSCDLWCDSTLHEGYYYRCHSSKDYLVSDFIAHTVIATTDSKVLSHDEREHRFADFFVLSLWHWTNLTQSTPKLTNKPHFMAPVTGCAINPSSSKYKVAAAVAAAAGECVWLISCASAEYSRLRNLDWVSRY